MQGSRKPLPHKKGIMEKRLDYVKKLLDQGYSRIEAVEMLAEWIPEDPDLPPVAYNTAKTIVYMAFPGSTYSKRRRRWQRKPTDVKQA